MSKRFSLHVLFVSIILVTATGCMINKAIPASAIADNLAVEKAQNEMLLLNVLRGKDHHPMVVTGISKITGSIKAEASLSASIPFGSFKGDGSRSASNYVASPAAVYNWSPTFDVNVFDTNEFMNGFLAPIDSERLAYYWNLGFYPQVLLNLMVLKIDVKKVTGCGRGGIGTEVNEFILINNHEWAGSEPKELKRFTEWVDYFLERHKPYFEEVAAEGLGPDLEARQAQKALINGLPEGLTLVKGTEGKFRFEREGKPKHVLKLTGTGTLEDLYDWTAHQPSAGKPYVRQAAAGDCSSADGQLTESKLIGDNRYSFELFLRSPEAMLYYLGELARMEEGQDGKPGQTAHYCLQGHLQPLFVVRRSGECGSNSSVRATSADGVSYAIPAPWNPTRTCNSNRTTWLDVDCDGGRSMEALTVISQVIALQKSAKDLPTTNVVRVVGQ